jgi:hypothetical protein
MVKWGLAVLPVFERCLIDICAPTLAGMKIAGLFRCPQESKSTDPIDEWDQRFATKGLRLVRLSEGVTGPLVYVFRPSAVQQVLRRSDTAAFLSAAGYGGCADLEDYLDVLKQRLRDQQDFPHEIGIFLGYPLHDVIGFIENKGRRYMLSGDWKVYQNRSSAERLFAAFGRCRAAYRIQYSRGSTVTELAVPYCRV